MAIYARGGDFFNPPPPPSPPVIVSFAPNTGGIDLTSTIILSGVAQALSTVTVYDGGVSIGTTSADSLGNWQITETNAANGVHVFTATATDVNGTSQLSNPFSVTVSVTTSTLTATDGTTILTATDGTTALTT